MTDFLYQIDVAIFYFFNHTISNPLFDRFFPFITEADHWFITYLILWLLLVIKGGRIGRIAGVTILLLVTVSDQLSSSLIKSWVGRIRPCNELPDVNILASCTKSFSFPSSHAVNNFAAAVFLTILFPRFKWAYFTVAVLLSISRPYVGVHYPSDIVAGALIGSLIGYLFALLTLKINELIPNKRLIPNENKT